MNRFGGIPAPIDEEENRVNRFGGIPAPAKTPTPAEEQSFMDRAVENTSGAIRAATQGLIPFGDEVMAGIRTATDFSDTGYDTWEDRYNAMLAQERGGYQKFKQENPKTAMGLETTASFVSPINKLGPVTQGGAGVVNALKGLGQNVTRNATEAALYGYGSGEGDSRLENARDAASLAAFLTGGLDTGGRLTGGVLDAAKLKNPLKTSKFSETGQMEDVPLEVANPKSVRAGLVRQMLGRVPGANERLAEASAPFVQRVQGDLDAGVARMDQQSENLDALQRSMQNDLRYQQNIRSDDFSEKLRASQIEAARKADADALAAAQLKDQEVLAKAAEAKRIADINAANEAAKEQLGAQVNLESLKASVPADRSEKITQTGQAGFKQALDEVNAAYKEAWGTTDDLASGTLSAAKSRAKDALDISNEAGKPVLNRIIRDIDNLGKTDSIERLDGVLRKSIDGAQKAKDTYLAEDLSEVRNILRLGLPDESAAKLKEVDAVYPNLLASQKATADAVLDKGKATPAQLLRAGANVAKQRRAATGDIPLGQRAYEALDVEKGLEPIKIGKPEKRADAVERLRGRQTKLDQAKSKIDIDRQRDRLTRMSENEAADLSLITTGQRKAFDKARETYLQPLKEARQDIGTATKYGSESPYMAALLAGMLPGTNLAAKMTTGARIGRSIAGSPGMKTLAGQADWQRILADAIRSGRSEYVTRRLSRLASKQEEEEY